MTIRDLGIEIGVEIDESPFADVNREMDELRDLLNDLDISNIDAMERELRAITADFNDWNDTIEGVDASLNDIDSSSIADVGGKAGIASKAMDMLKVGALAVGTAIGGIALSIGAFAMETDATFGRIQAQTGATNEEMRLFESTANEVFNRGYGENLNEVTEALSRVKQNMHAVNDAELSDVTANAMLLADIFDSDINEVTRGAQGLMDAFGITADKAFDLFTKGGQSGLNLSNDMFDQMSEFSPVAVQAGYSVDELFGVMQRGAQNGVYNIDRVNNAILEFGNLTTDGNKATSEAFGMLSGATQDLWGDMLAGKVTSKELSTAVIQELKAMDDQNLANQIGIALWGTVWEDNTKDVMYAMFETTDAMKDFEGAADAAANAIEGTFSNRITSAWRTLKGGITEIMSESGGGELLSGIASGVENAVPVILSSLESVIDFVDAVYDSFTSLIDGSGGIAEIWIGLGMPPKIAEGIESFANIVRDAFLYVKDNVMQFVNDVIIPLMPVAQEYIGTAFGYIENVVNGASNIFGAIKSVVKGLVENVIIPLMPVAQGIIETAFNIITPVLSLAGTLFEALSSVVRFLVQDIIVPLLPIAAAAITAAWKVIKPVLDAITGAFDAVATSVEWLIEKIGDVAEALKNFNIGDKISGAVDWITGLVPGFSSGIGRVPNDMVAEIHKDEAIIPADAAQTLRDMGVINSDGRYPEINFDNLRGDGGSDSDGIYNSTHNTNASSSTVHAPVTIIVQGGDTSEEGIMNFREAAEEFFADLMAVMPQVREG